MSSAHAREARSSARLAAHRRAHRDRVELARRTDEVDDPAPEQLVDVDVPDRGAQLEDVLDRDHGPELLERMAVPLLVDDPELVVLAPGSRAPCCRKKRSSCASGSGNVPSYSIGFSVARSRNGSGSARVTPSTVTCCSAIASSSADCVFGIARLISSTSTTFAKIGPGAELELARLLVEDREPGDVRGLEVGRALDARRDRALDRARDRPREHRLAGPGHVLEQDVPAAGQRSEDEPDLLRLAVDDRLDVAGQALGDPDRPVEGGLCFERLRLRVHRRSIVGRQASP